MSDFNIEEDMVFVPRINDFSIISQAMENGCTTEIHAFTMIHQGFTTEINDSTTERLLSRAWQEANGWQQLDHEVSAQLLVAMYCGETSFEYASQVPFDACLEPVRHLFWIQSRGISIDFPCENDQEAEKKAFCGNVAQGKSYQVDLSNWERLDVESGVKQRIYWPLGIDLEGLEAISPRFGPRYEGFFKDFRGSQGLRRQPRNSSDGAEGSEPSWYDGGEARHLRMAGLSYFFQLFPCFRRCFSMLFLFFPLFWMPFGLELVLFWSLGGGAAAPFGAGQWRDARAL